MMQVSCLIICAVVVQADNYVCFSEPRWRDKYPLHASAAEGDVRHVQTLLTHGQQHSKKDSIAWAPIHYAAW
jgi:hypothetical protein